MSSKEASENRKPTNKPFNKSEWRKTKYSHKSKLQQFEERRHKSALHKYYKELRKIQQTSPGFHQNSESAKVDSNDKRRHDNPYEKAKEEIQRRKEEKEQLRAEREKQKAEKEEALLNYKKEKARKYKKLRQKTKKGQPVMAGRIELLLEKIQKNLGN